MPSTSSATTSAAAAAASSSSSSSSPSTTYNHNENLEMWKSRWETNRTGWHREHLQPLVLAQQQAFEQAVRDFGKDYAAVLVPLCGKTWDLEYFANTCGFNHVVGIEIADLACKQFFSEVLKHEPVNVQGKTAVRHEGREDKDKDKAEQEQEQELDATVTVSNDELQRHVADVENDTIPPKITLFQSDFFTFGFPVSVNYHDKTIAEIPSASIIFDRASMVAISPPLRPKYVQTLLSALIPKQRETFQRELSSFHAANPDAAELPRTSYVKKIILEALAFGGDEDKGVEAGLQVPHETGPPGPPFGLPVSEIKGLYETCAQSILSLEKVDEDVVKSVRVKVKHIKAQVDEQTVGGMENVKLTTNHFVIDVILEGGEQRAAV